MCKNVRCKQTEKACPGKLRRFVQGKEDQQPILHIVLFCEVLPRSLKREEGKCFSVTVPKIEPHQFAPAGGAFPTCLKI